LRQRDRPIEEDDGDTALQERPNLLLRQHGREHELVERVALRRLRRRWRCLAAVGIHSEQKQLLARFGQRPADAADDGRVGAQGEVGDDDRD
jgi:hypothetical protein